LPFGVVVAVALKLRAHAQNHHSISKREMSG
jgi:hypothetical protein